jgi:23S rRNA G2445 N2-methylase RlmL
MVNNEKTDFKSAVLEAVNKPYDQRKIAERQLADKADRHFDKIKEMLKTDDAHVRRSIVEILRYIKPSPEVYDFLLQILFQDTDIKTRRRAAAAIGETGDKEMQKHLVKAFEQEEHRFVQASIILALGALGFEWTPDWAERVGQQGPIAEAFRKASAKSEALINATDKQQTVLSTVDRPTAVYLLEYYPGIESFVMNELEFLGLKGARQLTPGWIEIGLSNAGSKTLKILGEIRTILATYALIAEKEGKTFLSDEYIIDACKKIEAPRNELAKEINFRLELPRMESRSQYRKSVVRISRRIAEECGFKNNPSSYIVDIRIVQINNTTRILWRDVRWLQPGFREHRFVLPASIHPTVAASLCLAGGIDSSDVFCDPCCGAGTIIAERLGFESAKKVFGFDISNQAIKLSEQNLARFGNLVELQTADMQNLPLKNNSLNIIIANLPFGIRVGDRSMNRKLYSGFIKEAQRVLASGGRLVAYTQDKNAFEKAYNDADWKKMEQLAKVQAGGLTIYIYKGTLS